MTLVAWMLMFLWMLPVFGEEVATSSSHITQAAETRLFSKAAELFEDGKYRATVEELTSLKDKVKNKADEGLVYYWKGIAYNRLQDFPLAIENFSKGLSLGYAPEDLHYEYGQALFASEKYSEARLQFRESVKRKFKRAVSLYYIAYISKELGDKKRAVTFYQAIDKLGKEGDEVRQAAQVQIGDIYLEQIEKSRDAFRSVEKYVIPQYQRALAVNESSPLGPVIKDKIRELQKKYDLILFRLRNGRPVQDPPYFFRASTEVGQDTNVTFAPTETTVSSSDQSSLFARAEFLGRYTFYYRDFFSFSPEFRANRTHYFNRIPEIYRNDNYLLAPAIRTSYEYTLWDRPASHLFDYEYAEARRDVRAKEELEFSSRSHALMLGERFNLFSIGESIIRLRHRMFESYDDASDSTTTSLIFEQVAGFGEYVVLFYLGYDQTKVNSSIFNTNSYTFRTDVILPRVGDLFTPTVGIGFTRVDPVNDKSARGDEFLINPSVRLSRTIGKRWRANAKYDYQDYDSKDKARFAYKKSAYSLELEYIF